MKQEKKLHSKLPFAAQHPVRTTGQVESTCKHIVTYEDSVVANEVYKCVNRFTTLTGTELLRLKDLIDQRIKEVYDFKCNFMIHDQIDNYIYIVNMADGEYHYYIKGDEAYKRFLEDDAVSIERKTKDLFPIIELLLKKETYTA